MQYLSKDVHDKSEEVACAATSSDFSAFCCKMSNSLCFSGLNAYELAAFFAFRKDNNTVNKGVDGVILA